MTSYQSHTTSNASSISQAAALAALTDLRGRRRRRWRRCWRTTRPAGRVMVEGLAAIPGVRCPMPEGAFYAFADVSALYAAQGRDRIGRVSATGCWRRRTSPPCRATRSATTRCVRFSFATTTDRIREGVRRIARLGRALARPRSRDRSNVSRARSDWPACARRRGARSPGTRRRSPRSRRGRPSADAERANCSEHEKRDRAGGRPPASSRRRAMRGEPRRRRPARARRERGPAREARSPASARRAKP